MSSAQRLEKKGLFEEKKQRAIALSVEIYHLREEINRATDRSRPIADLKLDELAVLMRALQDKNDAYRELIGDLTELAEDLNEPMPNTDMRRRR